MILERQLIISLLLALQNGVKEDTKDNIRGRIVPLLEHYIKDLEGRYEAAKMYEEQCLQSDDGFSRDTEDACAETEILGVALNYARQLLEELEK